MNQKSSTHQRKCLFWAQKIEQTQKHDNKETNKKGHNVNSEEVLTSKLNHTFGSAEEAPRSSVAPLTPYAEVKILEHLMFTDDAIDVIEGYNEPANEGLLHIDDEEMVASCEEEQVVPLVEDEARKEGRVKTAIYW
jgi:hypothetical protein